MTEERDVVISALGASLDRVRRSLALLSRDREPDPFEGLESHHMAVAASAGAQRAFWTPVGGR